MAPGDLPLVSNETHQNENPILAATVDQDGDTATDVADEGSFTYSNTENPCLNFFFHTVPATPSDVIIDRLEEAWSYDPLTTLKLICNLRGVRGTAKCDKEGFYVAALWLHRNHPKTLACNVGVFANFGYYKDLLEILYRLLEGEKVREISKHEWKVKREKKREAFRINRRTKGNRRSERPKDVTLFDFFPKDFKMTQNARKVKLQKESARALRKEKNYKKAQKAYERYTTDPMYNFLYDCVADLFAEALTQDLKYLSSGEVRKISLASKWCPSLNSSYDKATSICEMIARKVFPRKSDSEYEGIEEAHYAFRVRDRLRKEVLVPLRKALELPEVYMCSNQWSTLPYSRVHSVAMMDYKEQFLRHDNKKFRGYLEDVKKGDETIAAGALLPHEIIASLKEGSYSGKVAELQWSRMVEDLKKKGKFNNCFALCNVSDYGTPMQVSAALELLISELSEDPWKGKVITFSEEAKLHLIEGDSLLSKTEFISNIFLRQNADFHEVFDLFLQVAVTAAMEGLTEDVMLKRVFVFSDMEFNQACCGWETEYQVIKRKFREKGFNHVPEIVFWNLNHSSAMPVPSNHSGVALVSGFSKNLVKLFLENGGIIDPVSVMESAISGEMYQQLSVFD
ncbi:hypothetical protein SLE2022_250820 [Rubroshorea leprosula]